MGKISKSCYIGKLVDKKHVEEAASKYLDKNEEIKAIFHGARRPDFMGVGQAESKKEQRTRGLTLHDYLILTNRRIILWMRGLLSSNIETIDYDEINNVEHHQGIIGGDIVFNVHGTRERFRDMVKSDAPIAADMIRKSIGEFKKASKVDKISQEEDPLTILKRRYAKGEISKKEYEKMKKDLE